MFGKTWGLKLRMVRWIYTAILVPQLTYASLVWWPGVERAQNRKALDRIYRLTGLGITGATRTTPTLALGALFNILPPYIAAEERARSAAFRLLVSGSWRRASYGHASILSRTEDFEEDNRLGGDWCPKEYHFQQNYEVRFPDRQSWAADPNHLLAPVGPVWYTDGARAGSNAGAGVWFGGPRTELSYTLTGTACVLQTELFTIRACAHSILERGYYGKHIYICSDSHTALRLVHSTVVKSVLVKDCVDFLTRLGSVNRVRLLWVPGHSGVQGNERAHELARLGASRHDLGNQCHISVSEGLMRRRSKKWATDRFKDLWVQGPGMRHTKAMFSGPSEKLGTELINLDRAQLRLVVGLVTGHWHLRKHLTRLGLARDSVCGRCGEGEDTLLHLITQCVGLADVRNDVLGTTANNFDLVGSGAARLLRFARESRLPAGPLRS
ncbi:PREDICTED: uncharacterized protein LOC107064813 [Polistes dominula]|uniref:Uncharacterized protein LOC107064813 n=1 Tax=Polistes dominula TaxID=743375 RepID=A0ABM1HZJ4_POLDO|nr:PREDICTED: uncharacterized protein LOC107064813 [Polistes dominula]XP_015173381.1 PREDICTED: uncharacterized protein LOC107064813 [Polistes dominula]